MRGVVPDALRHIDLLTCMRLVLCICPFARCPSWRLNLFLQPALSKTISASEPTSQQPAAAANNPSPAQDREPETLYFLCIFVPSVFRPTRTLCYSAVLL